MKHKYMVAMVVELDERMTTGLEHWATRSWYASMREGLLHPKSMQLHDVQVYKLGEDDEIPEKPTTHLTDLFDGWPE